MPLRFGSKNNSKQSKAKQTKIKKKINWKKKLLSLQLNHPLSFIYTEFKQSSIRLFLALTVQPGILTKSEVPMTSERGWLSSSPLPLNRAFCQGPSFKSKSMCSCLGPHAERFPIVLWGLAVQLTCWRGSFCISSRYQLLRNLWHVLPNSEHGERRHTSIMWPYKS